MLTTAWSVPVWVYAVASAELFSLLARAGAIRILIKAPDQRTADEEHRRQHGLGRGLLLEFLALVPASCVLALWLSTPLIDRWLDARSTASSLRAAYTLLGICSYGFPFATVKGTVTAIALTTLRNFSTLVSQQATTALQKEESRP